MNIQGEKKRLLRAQIGEQTVYDEKCHHDIAGAPLSFQAHHYLTHLMKYKLRLEDRIEWLTRYQERPGMREDHEKNLINMGLILLSTMRICGVKPNDCAGNGLVATTPETLNQHLRWPLADLAKICDDCDHVSQTGENEREKNVLWTTAFQEKMADGAVVRKMASLWHSLIDLYEAETGKNFLKALDVQRGKNYHKKFGAGYSSAVLRGHKPPRPY